MEEAESGGDVSYAEVVRWLQDLGGAAGAVGVDGGSYAAGAGVVDIVAERGEPSEAIV
jgi:hypothetical protein